MNAPLRYIVLDTAPQAKGLGCTADELADALRAPLAAIGVRVVRQRGAITNSSLSEFQARGLSRRQYEAKAIQVTQIVDEVSAALRREDFMQSVNTRSVSSSDLLVHRLTALGLDLSIIEKRCGGEWSEGIKRWCIRCGFTRVCEEDLRRDPNSPVWKNYCPNAVRLIALSRLLTRAVVM